MNENFYGSVSSPVYGIVSVTDFGDSNSFPVVSHCCFNLIEDVEHLLIGHVGITFLVRYLLRSSSPFFNWLVFWVVSVRHILWIIALHQMFLLQLFSPSWWLVYSLSWKYLSKSRILKFSLSSVLFCFVFLWIIRLDVVFKKSLPKPQSSGFSRCYFLGI